MVRSRWARGDVPSNAVDDLLGDAALDAGAAEPLLIIGRAWQRRPDVRDAGEVVGTIAQLAQHVRLIVHQLAHAARRIPEVGSDFRPRRRHWTLRLSRRGLPRRLGGEHLGRAADEDEGGEGPAPAATGRAFPLLRSEPIEIDPRL
eukprot:scaffold23062_cov121-Isochrysis_galbana.AAC.4